MMSKNKANIESLVFRSNDFNVADGRAFSGYGIVFNEDSLPLHIFDEKRGLIKVVEQISRDSLRHTDMTDVISAFNHNFEKILARTDAGTLMLSTDHTGVKYGFSTPETTYGNDLLVSTKRGDIKGSSFVFSVDPEQGYEIQERSDGVLLATPRAIKKIYEMGPVVNPAYPTTTATTEQRSGFLQESITDYLKTSREAQDEVIEEVKETHISDNEMRDLKAKLRLSEEVSQL